MKRDLSSLIGNKFGKLIVIEYGQPGKIGRTRFWCRCDCGKLILVNADKLKNNHTRSCGCLRFRFPDRHKAKSLRKSWHCMKDRCHSDDPSHYKHYKAKGITYCDRWKDFNNFYEDMQETWKPGLQLDRIKNELGYFKENCRWNTETGQQRNKTNIKLSEESAKFIRESYLSPQALALKFNVSETTIYKVLSGKLWNIIQ